MPTFVPPTHEAWTFAGGEVSPRDAKHFWASFGGQPRGKTVMKTAGVWSTVVTPTAGQINAADTMAAPSGETVPAVFQGGHEYMISDELAAELAAAGYPVDVGGGYAQGYFGGY